MSSWLRLRGTRAKIRSRAQDRVRVQEAIRRGHRFSEGAVGSTNPGHQVPLIEEASSRGTRGGNSLSNALHRHSLAAIRRVKSTRAPRTVASTLEPIEPPGTLTMGRSREWPV